MTNFDPGLVPSRAKKHDACFDVRTDESGQFYPGEHFIELPFKAEVGKRYFLELRPKSGLSNNYGFTIINTPATIDYGYKGNVCLNFRITKKMYINYGQKICQMRLVKKLNEKIVFGKISTRGDRGGGHGSTGKF